MTTVEKSTTDLNKVRVLIWPENGKYSAVCLDLGAITTGEPSEAEAARSITGLIDEHVLFGLGKNITFDKLVSNARRGIEGQYLSAYTLGQEFRHTPSLSTDVQGSIREIEYKFYARAIPD